VGFDQLGADQPPIGGAVIDRALGLGDAVDEEAARLIGILHRHLHPIAFAPVARGDPGIAELHREGVFGEIALARGRGRWHRRGPAMPEHDQISVPVLRHGGEQIGAARKLLGIAGRDLGQRRRACGHRGQRALLTLLRLLLRADRQRAQGHAQDRETGPPDGSHASIPFRFGPEAKEQMTE